MRKSAWMPSLPPAVVLDNFLPEAVARRRASSAIRKATFVVVRSSRAAGQKSGAVLLERVLHRQ